MDPPGQPVDTVGTHDQVGIAEHGEVTDLSPKGELYAQLAAAPLQDAQQHLARDAGEHVALGPHRLTPEMNIDRAPSGEAVADLVVGFVVGIAQGSKRLLGEHHSPAERGVRWISLDHSHLAGRISLLRQQREVQTGWTSADYGGTD